MSNILNSNEGTRQSERGLPALDSSHFSVDERGMKYWFKYLKDFSKKINFFRTGDDGKPSGNWGNILPEDIDSLADYVQGKPLPLEKREEMKALASRPDIALLAAFLKMMENPSRMYQNLTEKHKQFYYRNILGLKEKAAVEDSAHVIIKLHDNTPSMTLKKGTEFSGGKDSEGNELTYISTENSVLNKAEIANVYTMSNFMDERIYYDARGKVQSRQGNFLLTNLLDQENGLEVPETGGMIFGENHQLDPARQDYSEVGFSLSSPLLWLNGGNRVISLRFDENFKISFIEDIQKKSDDTEQSYLPFVFLKWMSLSISTPEGMIPLKGRKVFSGYKVDEDTDKVVEDYEINADGNCDLEFIEDDDNKHYTLRITLDTLFFPVTAMERKSDPEIVFRVKPEYIDVDEENNRIKHNSHYYSYMKSIRFEEAVLSVDSEKVNDFKLNNQQGVVDLAKPFEPFGYQPVRKSSFYFTHPELLSKEVDHMQLNCNWLDLPEQFDRKYQPYSYYRLSQTAEEDIASSDYVDWDRLKPQNLIDNISEFSKQHKSFAGKYDSLKTQMDGSYVPGTFGTDVTMPETVKYDGKDITLSAKGHVSFKDTFEEIKKNLSDLLEDARSCNTYLGGVDLSSSAIETTIPALTNESESYIKMLTTACTTLNNSLVNPYDKKYPVVAPKEPTKPGPAPSATIPNDSTEDGAPATIDNPNYQQEKTAWDNNVTAYNTAKTTYDNNLKAWNDNKVVWEAQNNYNYTQVSNWFNKIKEWINSTNSNFSSVETLKGFLNSIISELKNELKNEKVNDEYVFKPVAFENEVTTPPTTLYQLISLVRHSLTSQKYSNEAYDRIKEFLIWPRPKVLLKMSCNPDGEGYETTVLAENMSENSTVLFDKADLDLFNSVSGEDYHSLPLDEPDPLDWPHWFSLELTKNDFGHKDFSQVAQFIAYKNMSRIAPADKTTEALPAIQVSEPWTPVINSMTLDYKSDVVVKGIDTQHNNRDVKISVYDEKSVINLLYPLGYQNIKDASRGTLSSLVPIFEENGYLYIGVKNWQTPGQVNIYFQLEPVDGGNIESDARLQWNFLKGNKWIPFFKDQQDADGQYGVISMDTTNDLLDSGIVTFNLPQNVDLENTLMDSGVLWLRASLLNKSKNNKIPFYAQLRGIFPQGIKVQFEDRDNARDHLLAPLPAESIKDTVKVDTRIDSVIQPYDSFGGKAPEDSQTFAVRASEFLRHKGRAITAWDYEHLILSKFPELHLVRCVRTVRGSKMGVDIVVIPKTYDPDMIQPKVPLFLKRQIEDYVETIANPNLDVQLVDPVYESVCFDIKLSITEGYDAGSELVKLNTLLVKALTPWNVTGNDGEVVQKHTIHSPISLAEVVSFLEGQDSVDNVLSVNAYRIGENNSFSSLSGYVLEPHDPRAILVPSRRQEIKVYSDKNAVNRGIGVMKIGSADFMVAMG